MSNDTKAIENLVRTAKDAGSPQDQVELLLARNYVPLQWQWNFHAASRLADKSDGPTKIGCGGARGPGKSHAVFAQVTLDDCQRVPGLKALFIRQTGTAAKESFQDLITKVMAGNIEYTFNQFNNTLHFGNGSRVVLGGFKDEKDIEKYIGIEYDVIAIEELNQLTEDRVLKLLGSMRTSKENWRPRLYASFNPGGSGHQFVKSWFIDPIREGIAQDTLFVPSTYRDNPYLNKEYIDYLESLRGDLGRAWREGDWDLFEGQFFTEWRRDMHVSVPFRIPDTFRRFGGLDFGSTNPFAFYWIAIDWDDNIWVYREYYKEGETAENNAKAIADITRESGEMLEMVVGDRAIFAKQGYGETIGDILRRNGIGKPGTNIPYLEPSLGGRDSRVARAQLLKQKLYFSEHQAPRIRFFDTCKHAIRSIPTLTHSETRPEDVDTHGEDHAYDAITYLLQKLEDTRTPKPVTSTEQKFIQMKQAEQSSPAQIVNTRFSKEV